jgi:hypothetical protein
MKRAQCGGAFGTILILILVGVGVYYVYQALFATPTEPPSCKAALNSCITQCRKTTTEAADAKACQDSCTRETESCEKKR